MTSVLAHGNTLKNGEANIMMDTVYETRGDIIDALANEVQKQVR